MEITFAGASFGYGRRRPRVLVDLDVVFPVGRTVLLGPNGAGKSTLLAVAASVLALDEGSVRVGTMSPGSGRDLRAYRRQVAWMPQTIRAAPGLTAREQVALHGWLGGQSRARAWEVAEDALARVQLAGSADDKVSRLSGGQRARIGLAQALAREAPVLLLDEPTASLDPDHKDAFGHLLSEVGSGRVVVVSTHEVVGLDEHFDHVVVLHQGRVRHAGPVSSFLDLGDGAVDAYRAVLRRC